MVGIGVIGYGYWGPNLVRNFSNVPDSRVITICDLDSKSLLNAQARYPAVKTTSDHRDLLNDDAIDAVAIATPLSTHFDLAMQVLKAGKHVMVEKPLAGCSQQAERLIEEADRRNCTLIVDHTFVYTGAVLKIKELLDHQHLGELYYYDSVRVNLGLFQHDMNVIWDLAVHDLSIMDFVLPVQPTAVSATGVSHVLGGQENIAYLTLFFDSNVIAHIHVNWLSPVKVRRTLIGGSETMIIYDDLEPVEKIKVYEKGITVVQRPEEMHQILIGYRTGDMWAPRIDITEALQTEAAHFIQCIQEGSRPITDGEAGLRVVRILEAAEQSMKKKGRPVNCETGKVTI